MSPFVSSNKGREFATGSRSNRFTCTVEDDSIIITGSTGTKKRIARKRINLFCDRFSETESLAASDYHKLTAAAPQLLALTRAMLDDASAPMSDVKSRQETNVGSRPACLTPPPDKTDVAQPPLTGIKREVSVTAYAHSASGGQLCITNRGMDFHYDSSSVYEYAPLLSLWTIHDTTGRIWYCYVGKAEGGADRPKTSYASVVRRLQEGGPYRPEKPTYRVVHQRMAEAVEKGFTIRRKLIRNVFPPEDICTAEAEARAHFSLL